MAENDEIKCMQEECLPLKTLEHTLSWQPHNIRHITVPLKETTWINQGPKTLLCHDMKGGYLDDRFVNGTKKPDNFSFLHWRHVDIFVYFSHWLVTIPPCSWINAAHINGTLVLGTFITEWDQGIVICDTFLNSKDSVIELCDKLVKIAVYHGFDGWLINIENKIKPDQIKHLEDFVSTLTSKMHHVCRHSQVIWYDSVTETGDLKWQNCLNEKNRNFFDSCDGIFLNYNWKEEDLKNSVTLAGNRQHDVYVGVDCFGRGCLGGGGYCTNIALEAARKEKLSVAIFAPGWVYETLAVEDFSENQLKFWGMLAEFLPMRPVTTLPFITSFCPGFGNKIYRDGEAIGNEPWYNLGLQQPQPDYFQNLPQGGCLKPYSPDAFHGGGSLLLEAPLNCEGAKVILGILTFNVPLEETLAISYVHKPSSSDNAELDLRLGMSRFGVKSSVILGRQMETNNSETLHPDEEKIHLRSGWKKRTYILDINKFKHHIIETIDAVLSDCSQDRVAILLGHLEIKTAKLKPKFWCSTFCVKNEDALSTISVQCNLKWRNFDCIYSWDLFYRFMQSEEVYVGTTSQPFFNTSVELPKPLIDDDWDLSFYLRDSMGNPDSSLSCCIDLKNNITFDSQILSI